MMRHSRSARKVGWTHSTQSCKRRRPSALSLCLPSRSQSQIKPTTSHSPSVVPTTYARFWCGNKEVWCLFTCVLHFPSSYSLGWVPRWPLDDDRSGLSLHFSLAYLAHTASNQINGRQEYETNVHIASIIKKKNERQHPRYQSRRCHSHQYHHSQKTRDEQGIPPNGSPC
jgi:hypothetical protein